MVTSSAAHQMSSRHGIASSTRWTVFTAVILVASTSQEWDAPKRKVILDKNGDGVIGEDECICDIENDVFYTPTVTRDIIDYSALKKYEVIATSIAAAATALNGDIEPQATIDLLSDMLYQDTRGVVGTWMCYSPDSYGTALNKSYDLTKGFKLVSTFDCGLTGSCNFSDEHVQERLTERFIEQLGRNATEYCPYVYANGCCNPVSYGDYLGKADWAWMNNYFAPDPSLYQITLPISNYLFGNISWMDAGLWSDPYQDPVAGNMVTFSLPFVTRIPMPGSVDPFVFNVTGRASPGFIKSSEGLYVLGSAGIDVRLKDVVLHCEAGFYSTYPTCSACPPGKYRSDADPGHACIDCARGSYADTNSSTACTLCSRGYFQQVVGSTTCKACEPGTSQSDRGMSTCLLCAPGSAIAGSNASDCTRCPIGSFATARGSLACVECPNSMATGGLGSVSVDECLCGEHAFLSATSKVCEPCPFGMSCPVGSVEPSFGVVADTPQLLPGYYSSVDRPLSIYSCADKTSCPGGVPGTCGGGHIGLACQLCGVGQYASVDGGCHECKDAGAGLFFALFVICLIGVVMSHVAVNFPLLRTKRSSMAGVFLVGLVVTTMLSFNIYLTLCTAWVYPLSDLFSVLRVVALDLKMLRFSCFAGSSKLLPRYVFKIVAIPGGFLVACLGSFMMRFTRWTRDYAFFSIPDLINTGGFLFSVLFIAVSLASLEGFMCVRNPNGTDSLSSDRSVVCWNSPDHRALAAASTTAIFFYPVSFLVLTSFCSLKYYPLAERFGTKFTFSMRFLVSRWKPDLYYFGIMYTIRNFALTLAPIIQPNNYDAQVLLLQLIYLIWLLVQLSLRPWRFGILNKFDTMSSTMQIIVLTCLGLLGGRSTADSLRAEDLGFVAFGAFLLFVGATFSAAVWSLAHKFRRAKVYGFFLSHHKGANALYARQVKLMLAMVTARTAFLDVDNLASLDELVFMLRSSVENVVVMLSPEVLKRFWCAVEITCAVQNQMPIVLTQTHPVADLFSTEYLDSVASVWTPEQIKDFRNVGIDMSSDTQFAYRFIADLPVIEMMMDSSESSQMEAILKIVSASKGCRLDKSAYKIESHQVSYIVYNTYCSIQTCCARILCMLMKTHRWKCSILFDESRGPEANAKCVMLALVCHGFPMDPIGVGHACYLTNKGVPFTTIVSQEDFQAAMPSRSYLMQLELGAAFKVEQLTILERIAPGTSASSIAGVVVGIYASLAVALDPSQSEHLLLVQIATIIKRAEQNLSGTMKAKTTCKTSQGERVPSKDSKDSISLPAVNADFVLGDPIWV